MSQEKIKNRLSTLKEVQEIKWPSSETGGVMPVSIQSRFENQRHRLSEDYNEKWKQYRIKYLKSLMLERVEPRDVPGLYKELNNPIRRFFKAPFNFYEKLAAPYIGKHNANVTKKGLGIFTCCYLGTLFGYYSFVYSENSNNWETYGTLTAFATRPEIMPADPAYPLKNPKPYDWSLTLVILACALPQFGNYWPLIMTLFYLFSPVPTLMARKREEIGTSNTSKELALFITAGIVISAFALPIVLARSPVNDHVLKSGACVLTLFGNAVTFLTILGFFVLFDSEEDGYNNMWA